MTDRPLFDKPAPGTDEATRIEYEAWMAASGRESLLEFYEWRARRNHAGYAGNRYFTPPPQREPGEDA